MKNITIKTGSEKDFFARGRRLAKCADQGKSIQEERIISFEDQADMVRFISLHSDGKKMSLGKNTDIPSISEEDKSFFTSISISNRFTTDNALKVFVDQNNQSCVE
jgi:hypothetical protein